MKTATVTVATLMLCLSSAYTAEDRHSSNFFLPHCKSNINPNFKVGESIPAYISGQCMGEIQGMSSILAIIKEGVIPCANMPKYKAANWNQITLVVVRYMETHPQDLHEDFTVLTVLALEDA
jgi:hypothetical protein